MKSGDVLGRNPDEILGAAKATQFLFAELVVVLGYGEYFSKRTKDMEHVLMEKGLTSIEDGSPSATSEDLPYYFEGIRSSLQHISDLIDDKLASDRLPEGQSQLVTESATTDSTESEY